MIKWITEDDSEITDEMCKIYAEENWPRLSFDVTFSKQCRWKGTCDIKNTLDDINSPC